MLVAALELLALPDELETVDPTPGDLDAIAAHAAEFAELPPIRDPTFATTA